jgi:hypothetical protein
MMRDNSSVGGRADRARGQVPVQVVLRGGPEGWHYLVKDQSGEEQLTPLPTLGTRWPPIDRRGSEPPGRRAHLTEVAADLREYVEQTVSDRCFEELGVEADIAWWPIEEPAFWEGSVTLREPDPGRFPGGTTPFVVELQPERGALLNGNALLLRARAQEAWAALASVAEQCGGPPPWSSFVCGRSGHRTVRVGRGQLSVSTEGEGSEERLAEILAERGRVRRGSPELQVHLDGIDLLAEPSADVTWLLTELGYRSVRHHRTLRLPEAGLVLYDPEMGRGGHGALDSGQPFAAVGLEPSGDFESRLR